MTTVETGTRLLTTSNAITEAVAQEMERDDTVFVMGEDVGVYGGSSAPPRGCSRGSGPSA